MHIIWPTREFTNMHKLISIFCTLKCVVHVAMVYSYYSLEIIKVHGIQIIMSCGIVHDAWC